MPAVNISSNGTTETHPHSLDNTVLGSVAASPKVVSHDDHHAQAPDRLFVGPMPLNVVIAAESNVKEQTNGLKKHWWLSLRDRGRDGADSDEEGEDDVPEGHAFRYFIQRGGAEEDWGNQESLRKRTKREMLRQWRASGWSSLSRPTKKGQTRQKKWVGETFKIGSDFLGMPMQVDSHSITSVDRTTPRPDGSASNILPASTPRMLSAETYHTALEGPSQSASGESLSHSSSGDLRNHDPKSDESGVALLPPGEPSAPRRTVSLPRLLSSTSSPRKVFSDERIFDPKHRPENGDNSRTIVSEVAPSPTNKQTVPLRSALRRLREDGIGKTVQFSPVPPSSVQPAPPSEVLARRSSHDPETSAGAASAQQQESSKGRVAPDLKYGDVARKDRMLVRRSHVKSFLGPYFDEEESMKRRDLHSQEWKEFLVVWRLDQLELYEDYSIPGKEKILGHKRLACVIPLDGPFTRLSLYSFVDLTFCLTCSLIHIPNTKTRTASNLTSRVHFHRNTGTAIFVFKTRTRTLGIDWMWDLWRQLGNSIPPTFEVHCPVIETQVRLHVPEYDEAGREGFRVLSRDYVVDVCRQALKNMPSWDFLIEEPIKNGARLELSWRRGAMLDWIVYETDVDSNQRYWAVLYGLCLRKPNEITHLEARIAEHRPTTVVLSNSTRLREPPAVEGYLWRIKPTSHSRTQVYLSTHAGCLFSISPGRAHPPRPPIPVTDDTQSAELDDTALPFRDREIRRGAQQILQADGFIDLRSIIAVRRAFQISVPPRNLGTPHDGQANVHGSVDTDQLQEDEADDGGDEALARHPDKAALKMRRSFELLMRTGHVVRFETYSCGVALEWISRLSHLVEYWTHRHRVDARQEMDLIHAITGNPGVILANPGEEVAPERPPDYDQSSEYLPSFWNWCVLNGCLSVVRNGRLFLRRGLRGQYKLMQLVLVSGHLIQFHITHGTSHHHRSKTISLLDAYVCSGHFATQSLPADEFSPTEEPLPRRFQDGLENTDYESNIVFVIWYRPHAMGITNGSNEGRMSSQVTVPPLKAKHKVLVLKARSKLERDGWCWALNAEIERTSRRLSDREAKTRNGGLATL